MQIFEFVHFFRLPEGPHGPRVSFSSFPHTYQRIFLAREYCCLSQWLLTDAVLVRIIHQSPFLRLTGRSDLALLYHIWEEQAHPSWLLRIMARRCRYECQVNVAEACFLTVPSSFCLGLLWHDIATSPDPVPCYHCGFKPFCYRSAWHYDIRARAEFHPGLIVYKIWRTQRHSSRCLDHDAKVESSAYRAMRAIIESATLYCATHLTYFVLVIVGSCGSAVVQSCVRSQSVFLPKLG